MVGLLKVVACPLELALLSALTWIASSFSSCYGQRHSCFPAMVG